MTNKQRIAAIRRARRHLHDADGYKPNGIHYREIDKILNALEADFAPPKWANIGPVVKGGPSLLDEAPTHKTAGIPLYVAFDDAWGAGVTVIAPEFVTVHYKDTSANPGEALYLKGRSGMKYWVGHIDRDYALGTAFSKGAFIAKTVDQASTDHGHFGVNGEAFLGAGKQFKYGATGNGPDYTLGSPTYRKQLLALDV